MFLRSAVEYCAATYHSMLNKDQSDRIEKLQMKALKTIYGWNRSYSDLLAASGLETLENRRKKLVDNFAVKTSKNNRFSHWFPSAHPTGHNTRSTRPYLEEFSRTERLKNSPVYYMRRRLNDLN